MKSKLPFASQMGEHHIYVLCYAKSIAGRTHAKPVGTLFGEEMEGTKTFHGFFLALL